MLEKCGEVQGKNCTYRKKKSALSALLLVRLKKEQIFTVQDFQTRGRAEMNNIKYKKSK